MFIYVPQSNKLREDIIKIHYNNILAKHSRHYKILELINCNYWLLKKTLSFVIYYLSIEVIND